MVCEIKENHKKILKVPERCETFERKENFDFLEVSHLLKNSQIGIYVLPVELPVTNFFCKVPEGKY